MLLKIITYKIDPNTYDLCDDALKEYPHLFSGCPVKSNCILWRTKVLNTYYNYNITEILHFVENNLRNTRKEDNSITLSTLYLIISF